MATKAQAIAQGAPDELWWVEHPPIYTYGPRTEALPARWHGIKTTPTNRGGLATYHGPGQLIGYPLIDLKRLGIGPKALIQALEQALVRTLAHWNIEAQANTLGRGVMVGDQKIASLGLRIHQGISTHGLALNVAMDLRPFERIDPCGFQGLSMCQMRQWTDASLDAVQETLTLHMLELLGYNPAHDRPEGLNHDN